MADLTEELVTSPEQALAWIRKGESKCVCVSRTICYDCTVHTAIGVLKGILFLVQRIDIMERLR